MRRLAISALCVGMALASPAAGQERPITDREPNAIDVAKTPVTDLNIDKQQIPALLIRAQQDPYELTGINRCAKLAAAVEELDAILGPDLDLPQAERERITAGRAAKTVVGFLIPFRGLIREVSGANEHERQIQAAVQAGLARRGFLKGVGQARGCQYPARSATPQVIASHQAAKPEASPAEATQAKPENGARPGVRYTSQPVIQQVK